MTELTDQQLTRLYNESNDIVGKNPPISTQKIFTAMRAAFALGVTQYGWRPMETAPTDGTLILGWCDHHADPYYLEETGGLTLYGAHVEGMSHAEDGPNVLVWGGGFDDSTHEDPNGARLPDWWFLHGSDFEIAANPVRWLPIPKISI